MAIACEQQMAVATTRLLGRCWGSKSLVVSKVEGQV
jgi:hypothetical protein